MATSLAASGARLSALWAQLARLPGGKRVFSWLLGWMVPYTGSIRPRVVELRPGYAKILMRARQPRRGDERARGDDQAAADRARHPDGPVDHLSQESTRRPHGRSALRSPRREPRSRLRI